MRYQSSDTSDDIFCQRRRWLQGVASGLLGGLLGANVPTSRAVGNESNPRRGLYVQQGKYWLGETPIRALGVNYFDCFLRMLTTDPKDYKAAVERCERGFADLQSLGIPFVRFNAGAFYPKGWELYDQNLDTYFQRMERFVQMAEGHKIGLIPSLFWTFFTQPGRAQEPLAALGNRASKTHELIRRYTHEVVQRFRGSPAIWAWEFGNEYNLNVDLPNQRELLRGWYHPELGMPSEPGEQDFLKSRDVRIATEAFAKSVRELDPDRAIFTGHAAPRSAAWHLEHEGTWDADSPEQWGNTLAAQNLSPCDGLSIHFYPFHSDGSGLAGDPGEDTLRVASEVAVRTGQPLWVGEFAPDPKADAPTRREQFQSILQWLENHQITLAAAWVYDLASQPENDLSLSEQRSLLEMLGDANRV